MDIIYSKATDFRRRSRKQLTAICLKCTGGTTPEMRTHTHVHLNLHTHKYSQRRSAKAELNEWMNEWERWHHKKDMRMKKKESRCESFNLLLHNQYESHLLCLCTCVRVHVIALNLYWGENERERAHESLGLGTSTWSAATKWCRETARATREIIWSAKRTDSSPRDCAVY